MSEVLFCSFGRSIFPKRGAGVVKSASLYTRRRRFWYACQRVGRASPGERAPGTFISFALSRFLFHVLGEGGERGIGGLYSYRQRL